MGSPSRLTENNFYLLPLMGGEKQSQNEENVGGRTDDNRPICIPVQGGRSPPQRLVTFRRESGGRKPKYYMANFFGANCVLPTQKCSLSRKKGFTFKLGLLLAEREEREELSFPATVIPTPTHKTLRFFRDLNGREVFFSESHKPTSFLA